MDNETEPCLVSVPVMLMPIAANAAPDPAPGTAVRHVTLWATARIPDGD